MLVLWVESKRFGAADPAKESRNVKFFIFLYTKQMFFFVVRIVFSPNGTG